MKNKDNLFNYGFTLIELMIVVAIIGVLSAIAVEKFNIIMLKAKEAATKGELGTMRSCIVLYYSKNEGIYPYIINSRSYSNIY